MRWGARSGTLKVAKQKVWPAFITTAACLVSVRHQLVVQTHFYSNQSTTLAIDVIGYTGQENIKTSPTFKSPPTTIAVDIFPNLATISHKWRRRRLNWLLDWFKLLSRLIAFSNIIIFTITCSTSLLCVFSVNFDVYHLPLLALLSFLDLLSVLQISSSQLATDFCCSGPLIAKCKRFLQTVLPSLKDRLPQEKTTILN